MSEKLCTIDEARDELEKMVCMTQGHDFTIIVQMGGDPASLTCTRCGRNWWVATNAKA